MLTSAALSTALGGSSGLLGGIGAGLGGIGGLLGGLSSSGFIGPSGNRKEESRSLKKQYYYQKALLDYQNEYNKPVNQMARLKEAGLNPNLIYGSISAGNQTTPGSVGSVPRTSKDYTGIGKGIEDIGRGLLEYVDRKQRQEQIEINNQLEKDRLKNEGKRLDLIEKRLSLIKRNQDFKEEQAKFGFDDALKWGWRAIKWFIPGGRYFPNFR